MIFKFLDITEPPPSATRLPAPIALLPLGRGLGALGSAGDRGRDLLPEFSRLHGDADGAAGLLRDSGDRQTVGLVLLLSQRPRRRRPARPGRRAGEADHDL